MTREALPLDDPSPELFDVEPPAPVELAQFLPLSIGKSLTGLVHVIDARGATFFDRAYQLRGYPMREGFKDEWEKLAPQIVDRVNGFDDLHRAATEAREALRTVEATKLPPATKKAVARALLVLTQATKGKP